ncbi:hypothetical protein GCM10019016_046540 [Streptomyces prasinosporus]|uniref:HAMP domain-containing protein n=1 Tax=Streptomyces prasinosporus TaxID=68256 RepID=A0ABP6TSZ3_9ACTN
MICRRAWSCGPRRRTGPGIRCAGEFLKVARTVNNLVDQLSTFTDEVTRVASEVGTEGKLGGQARVRGHVRVLEGPDGLRQHHGGAADGAGARHRAGDDGGGARATCPARSPCTSRGRCWS